MHRAIAGRLIVQRYRETSSKESGDDMEILQGVQIEANERMTYVKLCATEVVIGTYH